MMLADVTNQFSPPVQYAGWLACIAFTAWLVNLGLKLEDRLSGRNAERVLLPQPLQVTAPEQFTPREEFTFHCAENKQDFDELHSELKAEREANQEHASARSKTIFDKVDSVRIELTEKHDELRAEMQRNFRDTERALGRIEGKLDETRHFKEGHMNAEQNELLRHAVREFLAVRFPTAHPPRAILRSVAREVDFAVTETEVTAQCEFLAGLDPAQAKSVFDPLGPTQYWSATSAGVTAHERGH